MPTPLRKGTGEVTTMLYTSLLVQGTQSISVWSYDKFLGAVAKGTGTQCMKVNDSEESVFLL